LAEQPNHQDRWRKFAARLQIVIPAKAGIQRLCFNSLKARDHRLRGMAMPEQLRF